MSLMYNVVTGHINFFPDETAVLLPVAAAS